MATDQVSLFGTVSRALPGANADQSLAGLRVNRRGELVAAVLDRYTLADEGTYFVAHNATNDASTTLAGHAAPVLADADVTMTKPFIHCRYMPGTASLLRCYLDYIEIEVVTAGANGTSDNWAAQLDTGATRISSGGTAPTKVNPNMQSSAASALDILMGAPVSGAESSSVRDLGFGQIRAAIELAGDRTLFVFGRDPNYAGVVAAAASRHIVVLPPVVLGPTDQFLLAKYAPSQTVAGVYKVRMGWSER